MSAIAELPWGQWLAKQRWVCRSQPHSGLGPAAYPGQAGRPTRPGPRRCRLYRRVRSVIRLWCKWDSQPLAEYGQLATIGTVGRSHRIRRSVPGGFGEGAVVAHRLLRRDRGCAVQQEPGRLPVDAAARVTEAEQNNTSVVFEERAILKLFRRVACGDQSRHRTEPCAGARR